MQQAAHAAADMQDPFPELWDASGMQGIEETEKQGTALFAKGSFDECVKWSSKGIWVQSCGQV